MLKNISAPKKALKKPLKYILYRILKTYLKHLLGLYKAIKRI